MKQPNTASKTKKIAKTRRKTREELDKEARDRKREKKHRGHAAGSRSSGKGESQSGRSGKTQQDPRIGSKKPVPLGVIEQTSKPQKPAKIEKPAALTPEAELMLLENDERLDALLERMEQGETLSQSDQQWVDSKLDRIDTLMDILGISYDDDEQDEEDKADDLMRLLKGSD